MKIVRFLKENNEESLGIMIGNDDLISDISVIDPSIKDIVTLFKTAKAENMSPSNWLKHKLENIEEKKIHNVHDVQLLTPVKAPEVWACGVTYLDSRKARNSETSMKNVKETFYDKVYSAERPELFFKSTERRTKSTGESLHLRTDSNWQVPEPELCLVVTADRELIGYTIGNDMSSRDIEGENLLYLPQAKIWEASCSFGPAIALADTLDDPYNLDINCKIIRKEKTVFEGSANTKQLNRTYDELLEYLFRDNVVFDGTVLMTGTCVVPPDDFTLEHGDIVEIEIPTIGRLVNPIVRKS